MQDFYASTAMFDKGLIHTTIIRHCSDYANIMMRDIGSTCEPRAYNTNRATVNLHSSERVLLGERTATLQTFIPAFSFNSTKNVELVTVVAVKYKASCPACPGISRRTTKIRSFDVSFVFITSISADDRSIVEKQCRETEKKKTRQNALSKQAFLHISKIA
jgi:hypothetical protein